MDRLPYPLVALLSLLSGALATLAFAPFDYTWLVLLPPAALYLLLESGKKPLLTGWLFGLGFFGAGVSWVYVSMHSHGGASAPLAAAMTFTFVALLAVFFVLQAFVYNRWLSHNHWRWLSFCGLWILFEWLRSWLLTGFPWLYLGYPLLDTPLQSWAPLGGVWALSLAVLLTGVSLAALLIQRQPVALLAIVLPWLALALPQQWTKPVGEPLPVALVQADIPQEIKWQPEYRTRIFQHYVQLSEQLDDPLVIWPETAIPALYNQALPYLGELLDQFDRQGTTLIAGQPYVMRTPDGRQIFHNSLLNMTGTPALYHKQRLVPFGEYVPFENQLRGLIEFFNLPMSNFSLPQDEQALLPVGSHRLAAAICYEIAYPELVRKDSLNADILLTVSNDTWFGHSIAPDQHFQIARMRALENGRWLIRSTNNGISALINPQGQVASIAPRYKVAVLRGEVLGMTGLTPYQQLGVWPVLGLAILLSAAGIFRRKPTSPV